jgi:hypothetical protein
VIDLAVSRQTAVAMWSFDTLDWRQPSWQSMAERVVRDARDRMVILMHDGGGDRMNTIEALPWIIQGLRLRGFQFIQVAPRPGSVPRIDAQGNQSGEQNEANPNRLAGTDGFAGRFEAPARVAQTAEQFTRNE